MLNLRKLEKIALLAFDNALRLHFDAIALYKDGRYPSAFYLSVLSQEEIGKMHIVNDFVWNSRVNGRMEEFEEEWLDLLYRHPTKQYAFFRNSPLSGFSKKDRAIMEEVFKGELEAKKQGAVYVGLKRHKRNVDKNGKIRHPYQITKKKANEQISKINDYLLVTGIGIRFGQFSLDNDEIENVLKNKRFLKSLHLNWSRRVGKSATKRIQSIQKFFQDTILPV